MKKVLALLLCCAAFGLASTARAQDKATLDLLVKKGLITREEADALVASSAKPPEVAVKSPARRLSVGGLVQARYAYVSQNDKGAGRPDPADVSYFNARRVILMFNAEFGGGWGAQINPEIDISRSILNGNYLDTAVIRNTNDYGVFSAGLKKVNFALEEYCSAGTELIPVERSVLTRFVAFSSQFSSYHCGVFWDGKVKDSGFIYGAAITGARQNFNIVNGPNDLAVWANAAYTHKLDNGVRVTGGVNLGYSGSFAEVEGMPANAFPGVNAFNRYGDAFGYNPYLKVQAGPATFIAELIGLDIDGKGALSDAKPLGCNVTAAYRLTEELEPVLRFTQMTTGGIRTSTGTAVADLIPMPNNGHYDDIRAIYTGLNYYILGDNLKVQGGYEFSQLTDSAVSGSQIDAHAVRVQLQAMF